MPAARRSASLRNGNAAPCGRGVETCRTAPCPPPSASACLSSFCDNHSGQAAICTRSVDCSVRSLWRAVQIAVDQVLSKATLRDLLQNEEEMNSWVRTIPGANGLRLMQ